MPRINSLDPTRRRLERISDFIRREMRARKIQQADMAAELLISQQAFSVKLSKGTFSAEQLIRIFDKLQTDSKTTGELIHG